MEKIMNLLTQLGLSEKESLTYVSLLKSGSSTVGNLSERCSLKRPTLYLVLEELRKKGFVLKVPHAKKQVFIAKPLDDFLHEQKQKIKKLESFSPMVDSFSKNNSSSKVLLFEGVSGMKEAYSYKIDELKNSEFLGFYSHVSDAYDKNLLSLVNKNLEKTAKLGVKRRGFVPDHSSMDEYVSGKYPLEAKRLPFEKYDSEVALEIRGSFIAASSVRDMQFLIIENPSLAKALKQVFELLWEKVE